MISLLPVILYIFMLFIIIEVSCPKISNNWKDLFEVISS